METIKPYAVILAGGRGSRLPIAGSTPKQFAPKFNDVTFVQDVVKMITDGAIKPARTIIVVTNEEQRNLAISQLTPLHVPSTNVVMFDPHLGYVAVMAAAADYVRGIDPEGVIFFSPSDQHIVGQEEFTAAIEMSCAEAAKGKPVLVGVKVADANIVGGCGNAMYDAAQTGPFYDILDFIEKPLKNGGPERVKKILLDDNTVVNTGFYAVKAEQFCQAYPLHHVVKLLDDYYVTKSEKTDLGLDPTEMVKALNMKLMIGNFEWMDCGTLAAYYDIQHKTPNHRNASIGQVTRFKCMESMFVSSTKGVHIYSSFIKDNIAVLAFMTKEGELNVAVVNMAMSQLVGDITDFFESGSAMSYSLKSRNCFVMPSNLSDVTRVAFLGVQNIFVFTNRLDDGDINVNVSANGECVYDE